MSQVVTNRFIEGWTDYLDSSPFKEIGVRYHFSGSRILSPDEVVELSDIPDGKGGAITDLDIALYVPKEHMHTVRAELDRMMFVTTTDEQHAGRKAAKFISFKMDIINIVVTTDAGFYRKHQLATELGKNLGLVGKPARIAWFRKILYGESMLPVPEPVVEDCPVPEPDIKDLWLDDAEYEKISRWAETVTKDGTLFDKWSGFWYEGGQPKLHLAQKKPPVDWRSEQRDKHKARYRK